MTQHVKCDYLVTPENSRQTSRFCSQGIRAWKISLKTAKLMLPQSE